MAETGKDPTSPALSTVPGIGRRLVVALYESLLLLGVLSVTFIVPNIAVGMVHGTVPDGHWLWLHLATVLGIYFVWLWSLNGQTLAMQTWRVRLIDAATGEKVTWRRALLRYALAWPAWLACGVTVIWALFDRDGQYLHDRMAGTRLVTLPKMR